MANKTYGVGPPLFPYKTDLSHLSGLNTISVAPEHQRQGVGSMLLQWGCDKADSCGWNSFVMASPAGVQLYRKFDFEPVGQVQTKHGIFTSMFRESRPFIERNDNSTGDIIKH